MGWEDNSSEEHAPVLRLNDAAWTISCGKADVAPISRQSLPKYALQALHEEGRVPDPLAGFVSSLYLACAHPWRMLIGTPCAPAPHTSTNIHYFGRRNEEELHWIARETWTFKRAFDLPEKMRSSGMSARELVLEGVDTVAAVSLNGKHIADLENVHRLLKTP